MAHLASKKYPYVNQLFILISLVAMGLLIGTICSFLPLLQHLKFTDIAQGKINNKFIEDLLVPANATTWRVMQLISVFFTMLIPALLYAKIVHNKTATHLGLVSRPQWFSIALTVVIIFCAQPLVSAIQNLTLHLPWGPETLAKFDKTEEAYMKQVMVIGRMNGLGDLLISTLIIALLPAIFEELIFRGALQNLLSRWLKNPIAAVTITALFFSLIHASYIGFIPRAILGFVLGWLFLRTNNLWYSILAHFLNNLTGVLVLYFITKAGKPITTKALEAPMPTSTAIAAVVIFSLALYFLLQAFGKRTAESQPNDGLEEDINATPNTNFNF
jgi:uncharacterized protein